MAANVRHEAVLCLPFIDVDVGGETEVAADDEPGGVGLVFWRLLGDITPNPATS